jgi:hypothetical protein
MASRKGIVPTLFLAKAFYDFWELVDGQGGLEIVHWFAKRFPGL